MGQVHLTRDSAGIVVSRRFESLPAAMAGVEALLGVVEAAFVPAPALPPAVEALVERAEADDPQIGGLKAGEAYLADFGPNALNPPDSLHDGS